MERATFGGGCFWCTEAIFKRLNGVISVEPGYSGGFIKNPTYEEVCKGNTDHVEVVQIEFDSKIVNFTELLEIFFYTHDPTTINKQGNDIGTQYRSVVFYHSDKQKQDAEKFIKKLENENVYNSQIVTSLEEFKDFYNAEDYHKNYFDKNINAPYCNITISPKVDKLLEKYKSKIKNEYKKD